MRTPIGRFRGGLADVPAITLGSQSIAAALARSGIAASAVEEVIMGQVLTAELGQNPARQAAVGAGVDPIVGATTINKVCGSGLKSVMVGAQAIRCGDASVVVAGGMESMSRAPLIVLTRRSSGSFAQLLAPIVAIAKLLKQLSLSISDIDLFEIIEAFTCVPLAAMRELSIPHERLNVHGGAIALGHPIGASGTRVLVTLVHAMQARSARLGIAALCIGGGEAVAIGVEAATDDAFNR